MQSFQNLGNPDWEEICRCSCQINYAEAENLIANRRVASGFCLNKQKH